MKLFVTGAGGQLGQELVLAIHEAGHEVVATTHAQLDITDQAAVRNAISSAKPDVVIHAAAWTAVDACESDVAKAMLVNGTASQHVADAAHEVGAHVVYISTDYVFDGSKPTPYNEDDAPNPQSVYGASKLAGEQAMGIDDAIVRISWVCGYHGSNMVKTILKLGATMPELKFVNDQIGNPTFADDAARAIVRIAMSGKGGIWHVTNQGAVSWYQFARDVLQAAGMDPDKVKPISTSDLQPPRPARRPANSVLHNGAMQTAGFDLLADYHAPLARLVRRLQADTGE